VVIDILSLSHKKKDPGRGRGGKGGGGLPAVSFFIRWTGEGEKEKKVTEEGEKKKGKILARPITSFSAKFRGREEEGKKRSQGGRRENEEAARCAYHRAASKR